MKGFKNYPGQATGASSTESSYSIRIIMGAMKVNPCWIMF